MTWWPTLLILQATKFNLGIPNNTRIDAVADACETIQSITGDRSHWELEVMDWNMSNVAKRVTVRRKTYMEQSLGWGGCFTYTMDC